MPENGLISGEMHHQPQNNNNNNNNNESSMSTSDDPPQENQHDPDSWLDVLRIPPAQVHKSSVTSHEVNMYYNILFP